MKSITVFIENLAGDPATNAYVTMNKFDGVEQNKTQQKFNPKEVQPLGDKQQKNTKKQ